jgi:ABC-type nickel/cobalt efflux system permease component RcnA
MLEKLKWDFVLRWIASIIGASIVSWIGFTDWLEVYAFVMGTGFGLWWAYRDVKKIGGK